MYIHLVVFTDQHARPGLETRQRHMTLPMNIRGARDRSLEHDAALARAAIYGSLDELVVVGRTNRVVGAETVEAKQQFAEDAPSGVE